MSHYAKNLPHVTVILQNSIKTCRDMFRGIIQYEHAYGPWHLDVLEGYPGEQKKLRLNRDGGMRGIIVFSQDQDTQQFFNLPRVPTVVIDPQPEWRKRRKRNLIYGILAGQQESVAKMAAEHFLERKFQHFAYVGEVQELEWSVQRGEVFQAKLTSCGHRCEIYPPPVGMEKNDWELESRRLTRWLQRLPKPIGLFVSCDVRARQILSVCFNAGMMVPNEIAVLGVDNDELLCESTYPPLSSILLEAEKGGELAARLLDELMHEKVSSGTVYTYGADYLVPRYSTDTLQVTDKTVIKAVEFIRASARRGINVGDVVQYLNISRRTLELRFKKILNRSVKEEIHRIRLQYVCQMLRETSLSVTEIAKLSGFENESYLGKVFRKKFQIPMSQYKRSTISDPRMG